MYKQSFSCLLLQWSVRVSLLVSRRLPNCLPCLCSLKAVFIWSCFAHTVYTRGSLASTAYMLLLLPSLMASLSPATSSVGSVHVYCWCQWIFHRATQRRAREGSALLSAWGKLCRRKALTLLPLLYYHSLPFFAPSFGRESDDSSWYHWVGSCLADLPPLVSLIPELLSAQRSGTILPRLFGSWLTQDIPQPACVLTVHFIAHSLLSRNAGFELHTSASFFRRSKSGVQLSFSSFVLHSQPCYSVYHIALSCSLAVGRGIPTTVGAIACASW